MRTWFSAKYHPISQSTVSDCLHSNYAYLDTHIKPLQPDRLNRREGKWPALEAALYEWQLAVNRSNHIVTGALLQEMATRFWGQLAQYQGLPVPKFSTGWLNTFKTRHAISRRRRHGEAGKVD
jgi:Tc5 transposase DNA-binding domain/Fission yeast centromere protein N-terminal domain